MQAHYLATSGKMFFYIKIRFENGDNMGFTFRTWLF